jgi:hypothetical protein
MKFNTELLYAQQDVNRKINTLKGVYEAKYVKSMDTILDGKNGQLLRFTFNDISNCSVVEILPLSKPVNDRYNDFFQMSYGKGVYASRNISSQFNIVYNSDIKNKPDNIENSVSLQLCDINFLYSEKSNNKLQNMTLGNELLNILNGMLDLIGILNKDISLHVHENVASPIGWRVTEIQNQINNIKNALPNFLSTQNFNN